MKLTPERLQAEVVLGVAAHPDDLDFAAGGTIAKLVNQGATAYYLILTNGDKGSNDAAADAQKLTQTRRHEQQAAARALGITEVFFLDYPDGGLQNTPELKRDIVRYIRQLKPDTVFSTDPKMLYAADLGLINHPDHRAAGQATLDAVYPLARDPLCFPELAGEGLKPHKVKTVLLANHETYNYCVDITDTLEQKEAALAAHVSQQPGLQAVRPMLEELTRLAGQAAGCAAGEALVRIDIAG